MATSHDTLLRLMQRAEPPVVTAPRILGLDDFAWEKGDRYGTLIIDQEAHKVVDVLPDREAKTVTKWLLEHPGAQIISRDRAGAYAEGARSCLHLNAACFRHECAYVRLIGLCASAKGGLK